MLSLDSRGLLARDTDRAELVEVRRAMLDRTTIPFLGLGALAVSIGAFAAIRDGQWTFAAAYLGAFCTFVAGAVLLTRLPVKIRAGVLSTAIFGLGVGGLLRVGLGGVGVQLLILASGLALILLGTRVGVILGALGVVAMVAIGVSMSTGLWSASRPGLAACSVPADWVNGVLVFSVVVAALLVFYSGMRNKLEELLAAEEQRAGELAAVNEALVDQVERREAAEAELRASEERFRTIFESAAVAIWEGDIGGAVTAITALEDRGVTDLAAYAEAHPEWLQETSRSLLTVTSANRTALGLYGAADETELAREMARAILPESMPALLAVLVALSAGEAFVECETTQQTLAGDRLELLMQATLLRNAPAGPRVLVCLVDVTERERLRRDLARSRKLEAIGTLAGGIAHDFNNLLMAIQGCVSLMRLDLDERDPNHDDLETIESMVTSGATLTRQLLGMARRGRYDVRPIDLNGLVEQVTHVFARAKKELRLHRKLVPQVRTVCADAGQIEQVLLNLLVNAWQAMPAGGDVYVETANVQIEAEVAAARALEAGEYVRVTVTDTGVGMDEVTRERIFEPYFTTKDMGRGTGLGLASALGVVRSHGGFIEVESTPGRGSSFTVDLPASPGEPASRAQTRQTRAGSGETVLLIDDEEHVRIATGRLLGRLGYRVLEAADGPTGIELFAAHADEIAIVMLDVVMPGMGGAEVLEALIERDANVRVLLVSGYSQDDRSAQLIEAGALAYLQKPFKPEALSEAIRAVLEAE